MFLRVSNSLPEIHESRLRRKRFKSLQNFDKSSKLLSSTVVIPSDINVLMSITQLFQYRHFVS